MLLTTFVDRILNRVLAATVSVMMITMLVVISASVVTRFFLNFSPPWAEESARYLMIWVCFLGAPLAVGVGGHVGVQIFMDKIPARARKGVRLLTILAIEVFLGVIVAKAYVLIQMISTQESPALRIPMSYVYLAVPVGCVLLAIEFLCVVLRGPVNGDYPAFQAGGAT